MNPDRTLAYSVMESIEYMTGHAPRRWHLRRSVAGWSVIAGLVALLLIAGTARAGTVLVAENQAGGQFRMTDIACQNNAGKIVMSTLRGGQVAMYGCAMVDGDSILVRWDDGDITFLPFTGWRAVGPASETTAEPMPSRWP